MPHRISAISVLPVGMRFSSFPPVFAVDPGDAGAGQPDVPVYEAVPESTRRSNDPVRPSYVSQEGFVTTKVHRGFTEIQKLFEVITSNNLSAFICGGYVRYMASNAKNPVKASDVDVYSNDEATFKRLYSILHNNFNISVKHENDVAVTFRKVRRKPRQSRTIEQHDFYGCPQIQLIKPFKEARIVTNGTMKNILENFDFTVVRAGLLSPTLALVDADFANDEGSWCLRLKNIHCPVSSTLRCCKYAAKGYWLPPQQALKLFMDWDERTPEYRQKLKDFLTLSEAGQGLTKKQIEEFEEMMRID